jgi:alpha-L-rhamnosidase
MFLKKLLSFSVLLIALVSVPAQSQWSANWIGQNVDTTKNTWMCFRKTVTLASVPSTAYAKIAADSKYWLWINGQMVVFEGQLKRNINPNDTYYDSVNLAPYLTTGTNTIAAQVWYWGKEGFGHHSSGKGGFLFDANFDGTAVLSDATWKVKAHPAYENSTTGGQPNFRLSEYNVRFNAQNDAINGWQQPGYNDASWSAATAKGVPPTAPWNTLIKRPYPQFKTSQLTNYTNGASLPATASGGIIDARLPYDSHVSAYLRISAPTAGQLINIQTDMYDSLNLDGGGPCLRAEYITKAGTQEFEVLMWISGNMVRYTIPAGITIQSLQYREIGYPAEFTGQFTCSDAFYNALWQKAARTLYVCMHDDFMDCPDRERGVWWGDICNQLGEVFYTLDTNAHGLIRKGISVLTGWQRTNNTLFAPPCADWNQELPIQMLASVGWYGFWTYFWNSNDSATIRAAYPAVRKYLSVWTMGSNGLVVHRDGEWNWGDWGSNIDMTVLENAWYYLALKAAIPMAAMSGYAGDTAGYRTRMNSITAHFVSSFWNAGGQYFMSSSVTSPDDRANAMAVLSGLAQPQHYAGIRTVLTQKTYASPWMEKYVLEALCKIHAEDMALSRMKSRYTAMVDANYTTLWEMWTGLKDGTINHGWNAPNTVLSQYIAGVSPTAAGWSRFSVLPQMSTLTAVSAIVPSIKGNIIVSDSFLANQFVMNLSSPVNTTALAGIPKRDSATIQSISANGTVVWQNGSYTAGISGITASTEDSQYIKFNVTSGAWRIVAVYDKTLPPVNLALAAPVTGCTSLENGDWGVSKLTDGITVSISGSKGYSSDPMRTSATYNECVEVDLGANKTFTRVILYPRTDTLTSGGLTPDFPVNFTIQTRTNGSTTYTTVATITNQANPAGKPQTYDFPSVNARYVRIAVTQLGLPPADESTGYRLQLCELAVYNMQTTGVKNTNYGTDIGQLKISQTAQKVRITLPASMGNMQSVTICDIAGRTIRKFDMNDISSQSFFDWNYTDGRGSRIHNELYLLKIVTTRGVVTHRMILSH